MEQDEITRRNVAIAEYMRWVKVTRGPQNYTVWETPDGWSHPCLEFEERYDLLMPVVEKIMGELSENIHSWLPMSSDNPKMFHSKLHGAFWLIEGMDKPLIERVWLVVSEYVLSLGE